MAESYLYNPSETIAKGYGNIQSSLGNFFTQLITQKQEDYKLAENTFENINALTDKLGEYGQTEITSKTQNLLEDAANSIIKKGKLDYSEVGRIRNEVSNIKNRKSAIEAGTQMLKEYTQTALATKDDLVSLSSTLGDFRNILLNPNNISAEDMGKQMQTAYNKNINVSKVFSDALSKVAPTNDYEQTYTKDGKEMRVAGKMVNGFSRDHATGKWNAPAPSVITNPDGTIKVTPYEDTLVDKLNTMYPQLGAILKSQMGENSIMQTDKQLYAPFIENYINSNNTAAKDVQVKSANQLKAESAEAGIKELEFKNKPTEIQLENQKKRADIRYTNAKANERTEDQFSDLENRDFGIAVTPTTKNVDLGKPLKVNSINYNGKNVPFAATNLGYDKTNNMYYISGYPNPKSAEGKLDVSDIELTHIPVSKNSQSYINFMSAARSQSGNTNEVLNAKLGRFFSIDMRGDQSAPVAKPTKATSPENTVAKPIKAKGKIWHDVPTK